MFLKDPSTTLFQLFQDLRFVTVLTQRMAWICFSLQECNIKNIIILHAFENYRSWHKNQRRFTVALSLKQGEHHFAHLLTRLL